MDPFISPHCSSQVHYSTACRFPFWNTDMVMSPQPCLKTFSSFLPTEEILKWLALDLRHFTTGPTNPWPYLCLSHFAPALTSCFVIPLGLCTCCLHWTFFSLFPICWGLLQAHIRCHAVCVAFPRALRWSGWALLCLLKHFICSFYGALPIYCDCLWVD